MLKKLRPTKFVALIACPLAALVTLHELTYAIFGKTATAQITAVRMETRRELVSGPRGMGRGTRTKEVVRDYAIHTYRFRDGNGVEHTGQFETAGYARNRTEIEVEYLPIFGALRIKPRSDPMIDVFLLWIGTAAVIGMTWCVFRLGERRN